MTDTSNIISQNYSSIENFKRYKDAAEEMTEYNRCGNSMIYQIVIVKNTVTTINDLSETIKIIWVLGLMKLKKYHDKINN